MVHPLTGYFFTALETHSVCWCILQRWGDGRRAFMPIYHNHYVIYFLVNAKYNINFCIFLFILCSGSIVSPFLFHILAFSERPKRKTGSPGWSIETEIVDIHTCHDDQVKWYIIRFSLNESIIRGKWK